MGIVLSQQGITLGKAGTGTVVSLSTGIVVSKLQLSMREINQMTPNQGLNN